jgi:uncharacterized protein (DUF2252 family)
MFDPPSSRPDPVALLEAQAANRLPELVPVRYGRMLVSPFTFYRGAAAIMASDLAATPDSGLRVQACGDAHLANFGAFGSPERSLVFDINDFDETAPGPWEWDVKRLVTSLEIAGVANGHSAGERRGILLAAAREYRETMRGFAAMRNLDVWYAHMNLTEEFARVSKNAPSKVARKAQKNLDKARTRDSMQAMEKFTEVVDGRRRISGAPPLIVPLNDLAQQWGVAGDVAQNEMRSVLRGYRRTLQTDRRDLLSQFEYLDMALKVVGVGSVGTRAWMMLLAGRDSGDPLFLQAKEAQESVLEPYAGRSEYLNAGQRVVAGQRLMQASSDIFLGWHRVKSPVDGVARDYYVRQLRDWKGSADVDNMDPQRLHLYGRMCAWTLAKAHARSGDRIALAAYLGGSSAFDKAIAEFAVAYAEQNSKDYAALQQAVEDGRIEARTGI